MKKWIKDNLEMLITVGAAITMIIAGITYFATAKDLKLVDMRLEQKTVHSLETLLIFTQIILVSP